MEGNLCHILSNLPINMLAESRIQQIRIRYHSYSVGKCRFHFFSFFFEVIEGKVVFSHSLLLPIVSSGSEEKVLFPQM